jgi:hypothetical protein
VCVYVKREGEMELGVGSVIKGVGARVLKGGEGRQQEGMLDLT